MQKYELEIVADDHGTAGPAAVDSPMREPKGGGRLPDFLGIGVQKGGTTTLHQLLAAHPGVALAPVKEVQYFTLHYGRGPAWYAAQFGAGADEQRCGEITPYYVFHPEAPRRIQALLPQVKLIVLLRDPVERALSQYFHSRRLGLEPLELEAALAAETERLAGAEELLAQPDGRLRSHQEHSYLSRSRYEQQLPRWSALFPQEQLLVLRSEQLFAHPEEEWARVQAFLGLDALPLPPTALSRANAGAGETNGVSQHIRHLLREALEPTYRWQARQFA